MVPRNINITYTVRAEHCLFVPLDVEKNQQQNIHGTENISRDRQNLQQQVSGCRK